MQNNCSRKFAHNIVQHCYCNCTTMLMFLNTTRCHRHKWTDANNWSIHCCWSSELIIVKYSIVCRVCIVIRQLDNRLNYAMCTTCSNRELHYLLLLLLLSTGRTAVVGGSASPLVSFELLSIACIIIVREKQ